MDKNDIRVKMWALIDDPSKKDEFNELWHQLAGKPEESKPVIHFGSAAR